ncbi:filamin/ABP280 repeat-containing protein [Tieghemostelium lacteum]|uniref:Filamin/ABP280 repeat-containing protein n=1 Tax=Tieghemostelium lacteum TaxID=361077 RepID=A0A151Z2S8_TIELA|nr:filamin/ABP280 repeat-containing protein [Tieghemostelium lacteum]|eukprot:KYQ88263.1 filamin/ABP280 repeat-containing protein [Tieghemostelium lacteum]
MGNNLSQTARDRIYICKSNGCRDLNLSGCSCKTIPKRILRFRKHLNKLNVGKNTIQEFYTQIERFTVLQSLTADSNEIKEICPNLSKLENLTYLDISNNMLTTVPNNLKTLVHLNISYNQINSFKGVQLVLPRMEEFLYAFNNVQIFPTEILELTTLKKLDLSGNRLNYLPDEINHLIHLEHFNISENVFTTFPTPIAGLVNLKVLKMAGNNLGTLSNQFTLLHQLEVLDCTSCGLTSFDFDLGALKKLQELHLGKNSISQFSIQTALSFGELTETLRIIDLSQGAFKSIPKQIGWIKNLRILNISQNQITRVPGELFLLNPSIDVLINPNPLDYPFSEWIKESVPTLLSNLKPFMKAYGPRSQVTNLESKLKAMAPNQFTIQAFDYAGNPRVNGNDEFTVKMLLEGAGELPIPDESNHRNSLFIKSIDCICKDNKNGSYTVFFNSPQTGTYTINVTSDLLPIQGSPFTVELV